VAKAILNLSNYSGGLNNKTNTRDIEDNEFQSLDSLSIDTPGKLSVMGATYEHSITPITSSTALQHGTDLWHMNTDRDPGNGALSNRELLLINDRANTRLSVYDLASTTQDATVDYGANAQELEVNIIDGILRVTPMNPTSSAVSTGLTLGANVDGTETEIAVASGMAINILQVGDIIQTINSSTQTEQMEIISFDSLNNRIEVKRGYGTTSAYTHASGQAITKIDSAEKPKWFGYINADKHYGNAQAGVLVKEVSGWKTADAEIVSSMDAVEYIPYNSGIATGPVVNDVAIPNTSDSTFHVVSNSTSGVQEYIVVTSDSGDYSSSADLSLFFSLGQKISISDTGGTQKVFTIDYVDESGGTATLRCSPAHTGTALHTGSTNGTVNYVNHSAGKILRLPNANIPTASDRYGKLNFYLYPGDTTANSGTGKWFDTTDTKLHLYQQLTYIDNQESELKHIGSFKHTVADKKLFLQLWGRVPNKDRLKGVKVFYKEVTSEENSIEDTISLDSVPKFLLFEVDFRKGIRFPNSDNWNLFGYNTLTTNKEIYFYPHSQAGTVDVNNASSTENNAVNFVPDAYFKTPPVTEVAIEKDKGIFGQGLTYYKTATILNRRLYIGNVGYKDPITNQIVHSNDTVFKSHINEFDYFTYNNRIDVEINDGEDIIKLESVNGRLLEFKKNTLYIVNVTRDIEYLESTLENRGVEKKYHVVKGEGFVAWFNKNGVFFTNGKEVRELLSDKKGQPRLDDWKNNYYNDNAIIAYIPEEKNLIITHASGSGNTASADKQKVLLYDLKSGAWSYGSKRLTTNDTTSFILTNDGKLSWIEKDSTNYKFRYFNPNPSKLLNSSEIDEIALKTKDFTFGKPSVNKKIISVYLNYKNGYGVTLYGFKENGEEEILATLEGDSETEYKTLRLLIHDNAKSIAFLLQNKAAFRNILHCLQSIFQNPTL